MHIYDNNSNDIMATAAIDWTLLYARNLSNIVSNPYNTPIRKGMLLSLIQKLGNWGQNTGMAQDHTTIL